MFGHSGPCAVARRVRPKQPGQNAVHLSAAGTVRYHTACAPRHIRSRHACGVCTNVPEVVGTTLEPHTAPPHLLGRVVKSARRLQYFITKYQPNFLLAVRSVIEYLVSRVDYVAKGSWLLQPECAEVGIVVTDGIECMEFSFGVVATAVSSCAWEWLAKLLAMLRLQHYRDELYMFCDNVSVQV